MAPISNKKVNHLTTVKINPPSSQSLQPPTSFTEKQEEYFKWQIFSILYFSWKINLTAVVWEFTIPLDKWV